jgi:hypothetical protein
MQSNNSLNQSIKHVNLVFCHNVSPQTPDLKSKQSNMSPPFSPKKHYSGRLKLEDSIFLCKYICPFWRFPSIWTHFGRFWSIYRRFSSILDDFGRFWSIFQFFVKFWQFLTIFVDFLTTFCQFFWKLFQIGFWSIFVKSVYGKNNSHLSKNDRFFEKRRL